MNFHTLSIPTLFTLTLHCGTLCIISKLMTVFQCVVVANKAAPKNSRAVLPATALRNLANKIQQSQPSAESPVSRVRVTRKPALKSLALKNQECFALVAAFALSQKVSQAPAKERIIVPSLSFFLSLSYSK